MTMIDNDVRNPSSSPHRSIRQSRAGEKRTDCKAKSGGRELD